MARRPRSSRLENRTSRLKLEARLKPYDFTPLGDGVSLGYRRNRSGGVWVVRKADGTGGNWTRKVGTADDHENADGERVLTWWQAQDKARQLAKGDNTYASRPVTVADAVAEYQRDLAARGARPENAKRIRKHLTATLASKPVGLLTARELSGWRDGLLATGMKQATLVRLCRAIKAALNLAARRDHRITNRNAWADGLSGVSENFETRNIQRLDNDQVRAVIAAAHEIDHNFGLFIEVAAETGARPSQISRLTIADLQDGAAPRLMMPSSHKGRGSRKPAKSAVPISAPLAEKLASDGEPSAPLLMRSDGRLWQNNYHALYERAPERAGVGGTLYAMRHSSITRSLLAGVPIRIVAATHDTSTEMIEATYSAFVATYADEVARRGLLPPEPSDNVAPFVRRG